jgi:hypothetical protein
MRHAAAAITMPPAARSTEIEIPKNVSTYAPTYIEAVTIAKL